MLEYFVFKLRVGGLKSFNPILHPKSTILLSAYLIYIHKSLTDAHYANRVTHIHTMCGGKKIKSLY
jgi:hypothetical protein